MDENPFSSPWTIQKPLAEERKPLPVWHRNLSLILIACGGFSLVCGLTAKFPVRGIQSLSDLTFPFDIAVGVLFIAGGLALRYRTYRSRASRQCE
jgi:hypothetical protein